MIVVQEKIEISANNTSGIHQKKMWVFDLMQTSLMVAAIWAKERLTSTI